MPGIPANDAGTRIRRGKARRYERAQSGPPQKDGPYNFAG